MKILVFTEGTIIMHALAKDVNREGRVRQSKVEGIQNVSLPKAKPGSTYDFNNYLPIGNAVSKLTAWKQQGAEIIYLTSRRIKTEIDAIRNILAKYHFPNNLNLYYRKTGEDYKDVAEKLLPDIIIEDDCESIGGEKEMTSTYINPKIKAKIKSIIVKEFAGIDNLPDEITN